MASNSQKSQDPAFGASHQDSHFATISVHYVEYWQLVPLLFSTLCTDEQELLSYNRTAMNHYDFGNSKS